MRSLLNPCPDQAILTVLLLALGGCIAIPVPEHGSGLIGEDTIKSVRTGETTREEILLNLGVPAQSAVDDSVFSYEWRGIRSYAVFFSPYSPVLVAGGGVGRYRHAYCVEFGTDGVVKNTSVIDKRVFSMAGAEEFDLALNRCIRC